MPDTPSAHGPAWHAPSMSTSAPTWTKRAPPDSRVTSSICGTRSSSSVRRLWVAAGRRPEHALGDPTRGARSIDVLLARPLELAVMEAFDWFEDVGAAARSWDGSSPAWKRSRSHGCRRRCRASRCSCLGSPAAGSCARRDGTGNSWRHTQTSSKLACQAQESRGFALLAEREAPMPTDPALLWVAVGGEKLWPARLGSRLDRGVRRWMRRRPPQRRPPRGAARMLR